MSTAARWAASDAELRWSASHDQAEAETEVSHRMNLLERKTGADEIAAACLFLNQGWLASGETLFVDSGQHLLAQPRDVLYLARQ